MKFILVILTSFGWLNSYSQTKTDSSEIIRVLKEDYKTMVTWDINKHRSLCTVDYVLIEDGEIWTMEKEADHYKKSAHRILNRHDQFDIRFVKIHGNSAYTVYSLKSVITEGGKSLTKRWNESVVFRKVQGNWKIALIHSTPIATP